MDAHENNAETAPGVATPRPDVSRRSALQVVWRRKVIVLASIAACAAVAGLYLLSATRIYSSASQIYVSSTSPQRAIADSQSSGQFGYLYKECEVIKSTPLLVMAMAEMKDDNLRTFADGERLAKMRQGASATVARDGTLSVAFEGPYRDEVAPIANALVKAYVDFNSKHAQGTAEKLLAGLQQEKEKAVGQRKELQTKIQDFRKAHASVAIESGKGSLEDQRLNALQQSVIDARVEVISAETAFNELSKAIADDPAKQKQLAALSAADGVAVAPADEREVRNELYKSEQSLKELKARYGPQHPSVQTAQAHVDAITLSYYLNIKQRYDAARTKEESLQTALENQQKAAVEMSGKAEELSWLQQDLKQADDYVTQLNAKIKDLSAVDNTPAMTVEVVEAATAPTMAIKPHQKTVLLEGILAGALIGIGLTFLDRRLRSAAEITSALGLPILGTVPHTNGNLSPSVCGKKVHLDPTSDIAEAYRTVRTSLYFGLPDAESKTLLITSPSQGDGKSTLVSNLAIAMAQAGQRTLILDADFRMPTQHKIFQAEDSIGLSSVLAGKRTIDQVIQRTSIKGLDVLPAGPVPLNPAEILNSQAFADVLENLRMKYDHVLVDSPPVMPVTDARILGAMCDVTLLVVRAAKTTRAAGLHAREGLASVGANIVGTVVNDVPRAKGRTEQFNAYGFGHCGYGETKDLIGEKVAGLHAGKASAAMRK